MAHIPRVIIFGIRQKSSSGRIGVAPSASGNSMKGRSKRKNWKMMPGRTVVDGPMGGREFRNRVLLKLNRNFQLFIAGRQCLKSCEKPYIPCSQPLTGIAYSDGNLLSTNSARGIVERVGKLPTWQGMVILHWHKVLRLLVVERMAVGRCNPWPTLNAVDFGIVAF